MAIRSFMLVAALTLASATAAHALCTANASPPVECKIKVSKKPQDPHHARRLRRAASEGALALRRRLRHGQAQAQDRLFQMELVRKSATGNLAEVVGRTFSPTTSRRGASSTRRRSWMRSRRASRARRRRWCRASSTASTRTWTRIYADTTLASVPHEFFFLPPQSGCRATARSRPAFATRRDDRGVEVYKPDAWRTSDVAAIGVLLAGRFGSGGGRQLRQAALLNYLTAKLGDAGRSRGRCSRTCAG
jgi:hypothetical protein